MDKYLETAALKDIADAFEATTKVLAQHTKRIDILESEVDSALDVAYRALSAAGKTTKKHNKKIILVGFGVGLYVGYKLAEKSFEERKQQWRDAVSQKEPANAQPKSETVEKTETSKDV